MKKGDLKQKGQHSVTIQKELSTTNEKANSAVSNDMKQKRNGRQNSVARQKRVERMLEAERFRIGSLLALLSLIIVFSAILLVIASILVASFKLPLMTMAAENFRAAPIIMIISNCLSIGLCLIALMLLSKKHDKLFLLFALLGSVVCLLQIIAVILAFVCRNNNIQTDFNKINVDKELRLAISDNATMETWDTLQTRYKCCGGRGKSGYREWENHLNRYPDSCCTVKYPDCGIHAKQTLDSEFSARIYERIHVSGCVTEIKESLDTVVSPLLLAWALLGILVVLFQLMLILLCFLFWKHQQRRKAFAARKVSNQEPCPVHGEKKISRDVRKPENSKG